MGQLPSALVTPAPPFHNTGVDYAGPIYLKTGTRRSKIFIKGYIALFICFTTRAIHLEAVSELTADAFIAALKRFVGRRGMPAHMHSVCGTNFVGANRELSDLTNLLQSQAFAHKLEAHTINDSMQWHFIPPQSPHFGGLWEAGVKLVKHHLRRIVGNSKLTLLCQIESALNSRPLCPLSEDPNDLSPLTPALYEVAVHSAPEPTILESWSREYVPQLQARSKWRQQAASGIKEGALVLLKKDNLPPLPWKLGRIIQLHPGADGITRVVTVKTSNNVMKRSVVTLCVTHRRQSE